MNMLARRIIMVAPLLLSGCLSLAPHYTRPAAPVPDSFQPAALMLRSATRRAAIIATWPGGTTFWMTGCVRPSLWR
ncbi:hypothetical protein NVIRENTERO_00825 [Sodalis praecaptivus]|nr:hypothetical protein NVIRENTERO_00825 [Sodalis praecaptivus]